MDNRGGIKTLLQIDLSKSMIELNRTSEEADNEVDSDEEDDEIVRHRIKYHYVIADEEYLPLANEKYDLIISNLR